MMNSIVIFFRFLFANFRKILLVFSLTIVFILVLFPLSDLNDLVTSQVLKLTGNTVFLQFDRLHMNPFTASLGMDNVSIETPQISALTSSHIKISPSIAAAFQRKPGGNFTAENFLKGDVEIHVSPAAASDKGADKTKFEVSAQNISLKEARQTMQWNLPLQGNLNLNTQAIVDMTMAEQPEGEVTLSINKFEIPSTSITTDAMGSVNVPQIRFDKVELKGKLANEKFQIESGKLGSSKDDLYGDIKGEIGIKILNVQGQIIPQIGVYNFTIDLKANSSFQQRGGLFLSFLDASKSMVGNTAQYKFRIQGDLAFGTPFQLTPMR